MEGKRNLLHPAGVTMARIIEFRVPERYQPKARPLPVTGGKVIEFPNNSDHAIRRANLLRDCAVLSRAIASEKNF
jgi:hypothetical protein